MTKKPAKRVSKPPAKLYKRRPEEQQVVDAYHARRKQQPPRWQVKDGVLKPDHADQEMAFIRLMNAMGTDNTDFLLGIFRQLANLVVSTDGNVDGDKVHFMLSVIEGIKPENETEAMLAAQMAVVHLATMKYAGTLLTVDKIPQADHAEKTLNKLARTFTTQMDTLKRYRTGGQQKMTVEHVHVHEGGQAIVGSVTAGGGPEKS